MRFHEIYDCHRPDKMRDFYYYNSLLCVCACVYVQQPEVDILKYLFSHYIL